MLPGGDTMKFAMLLGLSWCAAACNVMCDGNQRAWRCLVQATPCHTTFYRTECATDEAAAIERANFDASNSLQLHFGTVIEGTVCTVVDLAKNGPQSTQPTFKPQGDPPSCDAAGDDACVTCAKAFCCAAYQACATDTNCACLVGCIAQGNAVDACTSTDNCGAASSASLTTSACLAAACPDQCESAGGMASMMCAPSGTSSTSASSGGGGLGAGGSPFGGGP